MRNVLEITTAIALSILSVIAVLFAGNNDSGRSVIAQPTTQNFFPNNTETIADLEELLGDQNAHIILNGSDIANPNNTLPDSININIKEDCMKLPDSVHTYCP
jgi:hypothetical protein